MGKIILASKSPRRRELLDKIGVSFTVEVSQADEEVNGNDPEEIVQQLALRKAEAVAARHADEDVTVIGADTIVVLKGEILGKPKDANDARRMLAELAGNTHQVYTGVCVMTSVATHGSKEASGEKASQLGRLKATSGETASQPGGSKATSREAASQPGRLKATSGETASQPGGSKAASGEAASQPGESKEASGEAASQHGRSKTFAERTDVTFAPLAKEEIDEYIATGEPFDKAGSYGIQGVFARYIEKIDGDYFNVVGLPVGRLWREYLSGLCTMADKEGWKG